MRIGEHVAYLTKRKAPRKRNQDWRESAAKRGYGRRWARLRLIVLRLEPMCRACKTRPAVDVDHIVPLRRGGTNAMDNLQPLCRSCHSTKTHSDSTNG